MAVCNPYNGDVLLKVFKDLNIELGSLNSNVIRAWFDTDDTDTLNVLYFICSSLSKKNVLTPQELQDFEALKTPLIDCDLEMVMNKVESNNSYIFDYELNSHYLKLHKAELENLKIEEQRLDNSIKLNENLQQTLLDKKCNLEEHSVRLDFNCEKAWETCLEISKTLDEKDSSTYKQLMKNIYHLSNFQFGNRSFEFLNLVNLEDIEESDAFYCSIQNVVRKQHEDLSGNFSESKINLNSTPYEDNIKDNLEIFKSLICFSYKEYLTAKLEEVSLFEALNYLQNFFVKGNLTYFNKTSFSEEIYSSKVEEKELLLDLLEKKAVTISEKPIHYIQIKKLENELKNIQDNLLCFSRISEYYTKVLCITSCTLMLFLQEKKSIEESCQLIRDNSNYILNTLYDSKIRTGTMQEIVDKFKDFKIKPIEKRNLSVESVVDIYKSNTLEEAYLSFNQIQKKLKMLEQDYFNSYSELSEIIEKLIKKDIISKFLYSGPTNHALVIPSSIQSSLKNIQLNFDKQASAIKYSIQITNDSLKKLKVDNWLKNSRLVWGYFLTSPSKIEELLKQRYEEIKAKEVRCVRFKE